MQHKTKEKGDLGVAKIIADMTERGYDILLPLSEHLPFDLVAFNSKTRELLKVQVKCRQLTKGCVQLALKNTRYDNTRGMYAVPMDISSFDLFGVYCIDNKTCYYIRTNDIAPETKYISLRVEASKNNQAVFVRRAEDYLSI